MTPSSSAMALVLSLITLLQGSASMRSLDRGLHSEIDRPRLATARTAAEWETLWRLHGGERTRPAVDFNKELVVAVFLGSRPTAGFAVEIIGVREVGTALVVQYRETRPPAGAIVAQVLTMPYHIAAVPGGAGLTDVKFEKVN